MVRCLIATVGSLLAGAVLGYPTPFDLNGKVLRWDISLSSPALTYLVISDEGVFAQSFVDSIVDLSAEKWSTVEGSFLTLARTTSSDADISIYLKSSIVGGDVSSGFSTFDSYHDDGSPAHCRTEILVDSSLGFLSIAKTILHELGHCLGLGHSLIPQAIMSYSLEENSFDLDLDDRAAILRLYSSSTSEAQLPPGCGIAANTRSPAPHPMLFLLVIILTWKLGRFTIRKER